MQINYFKIFEYPASLESHIDSSVNFWENITLLYLDKIINDHMRLILKQTENSETAPGLQKSLSALSDRISKEPKFNTPEGRGLAFRVSCIAMGIYPSKGPKFDKANLPDEILPLILSKNAPSDVENHEIPIESYFKEIKLVSTEWNLKANEVEKKWFEDENTFVPLHLSCNTAQKAIQLIKEKNFKGVILNSLPLTEADFTQLIDTCSHLNQLSIQNYEKIVILLLGKLSNLKKLYIYGAAQKIKLTESLKTLSQLKSLAISFVQKVELDGVVEALKSLHEFRDLSLFQCEIPGSEMADALKNLPQLTALEIDNYHPGEHDIPPNKLAEMLNSLPNLTTFSIHQSIGVPIDEHFANALKNHFNLTHLYCWNIHNNEDVFTCIKKDLAKLKKEFPKINLIILRSKKG